MANLKSQKAFGDIKADPGLSEEAKKDQMKQARELPTKLVASASQRIQEIVSDRWDESDMAKAVSRVTLRVGAKAVRQGTTSLADAHTQSHLA